MSRTFRSLLSVSLVFTLVVASELFAKSSPEYRGQAIDAIDIHMHPGRYEDLGPVGKDFLRQTLPDFLPEVLKDMSLSAASSFLLNPYGPFIGIKSECESAGLKHCGLFAVYAPQTWGICSNESLISYLDDKRNRSRAGESLYFGLASVRMQDWPIQEQAELQKLRAALEHPLVKGIKLAFIHNSIPLDDTRFDSVYSVAQEKNVPIYHHIGSSPLQKLSDFSDAEAQERYLKSYDPAALERAIKKFPRVSFILGHMGFDFNNEGVRSTDKVFALAERYPNVYLEISAFGGPMHDPQGHEMLEILKEIKDRGLIHRTIYGSDGPTIPGGTKQYLQATLSAMEKLDYTYTEARAVLFANTARLFKISDPKKPRDAE